MMLTEYSSNADVSKFVDKLVREMRRNPYDPESRGATVAGVVEQAYYHFGRKRAKSIRITLH